MLKQFFFMNLLCLMLIVPRALAQSTSDPVLRTSVNTIAGFWQTLDHETGKPGSVIQIYQKKGVYYGRVDRIFVQNGHTPMDRCVRCGGQRHNQLIKNMIILWGMRRQRAGYGGGYILDPQTGRIYRVTLRLEKNGQVVLVHGYIGFSLLGRTEYWSRVFRVLP